MIIETLSVLPRVFESYMDASILGRARRAGLFSFFSYDLRTFTHDRHRTVDDAPFGGGPGMLMKPAPIFEAVRAVSASEPGWWETHDRPQEGDGALGWPRPHTVFFSPWGRPFTERDAERLARRERILFVCGRYEGMDERAYTLADEVLSLGDFVLTGAELCAMTVTDAVVRLLPGALGDAMSAHDESFSEGLLEYAQYTRPATFEGMEVPDVLLSGNHARIAAWRRESALERTRSHRPDLLA